MTIALYLISLLLLQQPVQPVRPESGSISGQLRGANGELAAGIRIAAAPAEPGAFIAQAPAELSNIAQTDGEGHFRLDNVRPGLYLIMAGSLTSPSYYSSGTIPNDATIVTVAAGQAITHLDFTIEPKSFAIITGTARFDDGTPLTSAAVNGGSLNLQFTRLGSGQNGSASLDPLHPQPGALVFYGIDTPGTYAVTVAPLPLGFYIQSMTYGSTDLTRDPLVLKAKIDNPIVDVVLSKKRPARTPPGVKLSGKVFNSDPASQKSSHLITLFRVQDKGSPLTMALVDTMDDGTFEIDDVPPGRYAIVPNQAYGLRPNYPGTFDVGGSDITNLEVGKAVAPVSPGSTTTIAGTVSIADGTIPEFEIQFVPAQKGAETRTVKISSKEFSVALPQGTYSARISGVPAGYASSAIAGPMDLSEPFLVTKGGIADRFTGAAMRPAGITVKLSKPATN